MTIGNHLFLFYFNIQLEESCIILENDGRFNHEIMSKTNMDGVNVVINYKHGIESFTTTTNCVSTFAYYIETVQSNLNENNEIGNISCYDKKICKYQDCHAYILLSRSDNLFCFPGMYTFLKALNFAVVPRNISYLLNQPDDIKKQLHRAISDGIKSGLVRPIDELNMKDRSIRVNKYVVLFIPLWLSVGLPFFLIIISLLFFE